MHHLPARLAPMMAPMSDALKTCMCALETSEPSCLDRPAMFFFMLEARSPQGIAGCVAALEPSRHGGRVRSRWPRGGSRALPSREAGSRAAGRVETPKPSHVGRRDPEPQGYPVCKVPTETSKPFNWPNFMAQGHMNP
jgi:hypothetical protein